MVLILRPVAMLIKTNTNNRCRKSVVLESFVKPSLGCQFSRFQKHYSRVLGANIIEENDHIFLSLHGRENQIDM